MQTMRHDIFILATAVLSQCFIVCSKSTNGSRRILTDFCETQIHPVNRRKLFFKLQNQTILITLMSF